MGCAVRYKREKKQENSRKKLEAFINQNNKRKAQVCDHLIKHMTVENPIGKQIIDMTAMLKRLQEMFDKYHGTDKKDNNK